MEESDTYNPRDIFPRQRIALNNTLQFGQENKIIASKYDPEGNFIYLGCEDGVIKVVSSGPKNNTLFSLMPEFLNPVTCMAPNPKSANIKNTILATYTDGSLVYWHATSKQQLSRKNYGVMLYCCGFSANGTTYSFAGEDHKIHIGNLGKTNTFDLKDGKLGEHSSRIFCTKWHNDDPNILYSGGWDDTLYFWDIRCQVAVDKLYGVSISGESIDVKNRNLLIGSETYGKELRLFDLTAHKFVPLEWKDYTATQSLVPSCAFDMDANIIAGTLKTKEVRLFQFNVCTDIHKTVDKTLYSVAVSPNKTEFVATFADGIAEVYAY